MIEHTINDKFLSFVKKSNIQLTDIEDGLNQTIQYFINNYDKIRK